MSKVKLAILALIIANIIWGASAPIFKWSLQSIHPFTLAFLRFALPALFVVLIRPKSIKIKSKDFLAFLMAGILGVSINIGGFFLGLERTESINSPIISSRGPIFLILAAIIFLKEKPTKKMLLGNLIGLTGALLIIIEPLLRNRPKASFVGNLLILIATFGSIAGTIFIKKLAKKYDALTITFWTFTIGAITFAPLFVQEIGTYGIINQLQTPGLLGALYGIIFSSFIAYTLSYWALKYLL